MEQVLSLKTNDGKRIHSILNSGEKKSDSVAVLVHGLTGNLNDHILHNAARAFPKKGVDVFRFSLYWFEENNRCLSDCSIATHASDLERVLRYLRPKYKRITVIGHSLGVPVIITADKALFDNVVFWEPSYLEDGIRHELKTIKWSGKAYWLSRDEMEYLLSREMVDQWEWFNGKNELEYIATLNKPLKIIAAKKGILVKGSKAYIKAAQEPKELVVIPGATHGFDEEGTEDTLLTETLAWIKKQPK